ncbi:MAG: hypothetical protein LBC82_09920, partial [Oscillospiraceae bacterium]|nr:hypothetical protein [Oscillospiraceae bacterium]
KNEWGERTQKVDIYFNFIGKFDAPFIEPELSPEEAEVLENGGTKKTASCVMKQSLFAFRLSPCNLQGFSNLSYGRG